MTSLATRRTLAVLLVIVLTGGAWYLARPQVPDGQSPLVTLDAASIDTLRDAFNRDAEYVRVVILQSPT